MRIDPVVLVLFLIGALLFAVGIYVITGMGDD